MNFGIKKFCTWAVSAFMFVSSTAAHADALDDLQAALLSGSYTLKYHNVTPPTREAMHEKQMMFNGKMLALDNPYTMYQPIFGIVTVSGDNRYVETTSPMNMNNVAMTMAKAQLQAQSVGVSGLMNRAFSAFNKPRDHEYSTCNLTTNGENFIFTRIKSDDKVEYTGHKKGKVMANKVKKDFNFGYAYDFGDRDVTKVLNAILPNASKVDGTVTYKRLKSGTLSNGQYYVDLKAEKLADNTIFDAIRYYFEGGNLVKIEAGQYYTTAKGKTDGTRTIINVEEFKPDAETQYFKLPDGLTDVTKRDETDTKGATKK